MDQDGTEIEGERRKSHRRDQGHNPRGVFERKDDLPITTAQQAIGLVNRHGPIAAIAAFLIYFLTGVLQGVVEDTRKELREHAMVSAWYQRQTCISLATLAGTARELCEVPGGK